MRCAMRKVRCRTGVICGFAIQEQCKQHSQPMSHLIRMPKGSRTPDINAHSRRKPSILRSLGLGIITGAADDDCSAVGTYAQAGAKFGYVFLWTAPFLVPMMVTVVYLSSKVGQVTGAGLFSVIRGNY